MKALAATLEAVRTTRSRLAKESHLATYLASLDVETLPHAARMIAGRVFPIDDRRAVRAGFAAWREAASIATGWDVLTVVESMRATGDAGEAIGLLVAADARSAARPGMRVLDMVALAERLAAAGQPARRVAMLAETLSHVTGLEAKYLVKLLSGGLRVGAQQGVIESAIARAFHADPEAVRRAVSRVADLGEVAQLAREGALDRAEVRVGSPIAFMLATPIQSVTSRPTGDAWQVEDKLDGMRAQLHKRGGEVRLFARSGDSIDGTFPEVEDAARWRSGSFVLDGEIVAVRDDSGIAPFAVLQERLNRKRVGARETSRVPVSYVAFDLLVDEDAGSLIDRPWTERRARLEARLKGEADARLRVLATAPLGDRDLEDLRREALERGAEGLVLKRSDAVYEAGRRGQSWIKVKEPYATLDVVITAAEEGHGKRRGMLSDYTIAVWRGDALLNVGKAYSGLTDEEIEAMTARLVRITTARYGRVRAVRPEVVLEVAFDGINRSRRHASGYSLRFPRIVRIRDDKSAAQANTLDDVATLIARQSPSRGR